MNSEQSTIPPSASGASEKEALPTDFSTAVESLYEARLRPELSLGTIRPPQRLARYSHAVGIEVDRGRDLADIAINSDDDAFGRLILLHDPQAEEAWEGSMRLVAYIQADVDDQLAGDPLLPDVAWQWLLESLETHDAEVSNLGGTVTATSSVRFGEIGGPPRAYQLELRASWTAHDIDLSEHVAAFADVLSHTAGLPPEGVTDLRSQ